MKHAIVTISLAAAATVLFTALSGAAAAPPPAPLHLTGHQISQSGPGRRPHPGSVIVLRESERGDDRGRAYVQCTLVDAGHALCSGYLTLARGTIALSTVMPFDASSKTSHLAITGGTGAYDGARGTVTFTDIGKDRTDERYVFVR